MLAAGVLHDDRAAELRPTGIEREASDIHVEPHRDAVVIRYRISGALQKRTSGTACPCAGHRDQCEEGRPEYQKGPGEHERRSEQTRTGATPHAWSAAQAGESNGGSRE